MKLLQTPMKKGVGTIRSWRRGGHTHTHVCTQWAE